MSGTKVIKLGATPCPRCGSSDHEIVAVAPDFLYLIPGEYRAVSCSNCGLWYQNPRPLPDSLSAIYPETYLPYEERPSDPNSLPLSRRLLRALNPIRRQVGKTTLYPEFVQDGRLLELGCASGGFLVQLRARGWKNLSGIELSPKAAAKARSLGFDVQCEMLETGLDAYPDGHFDVIVSSMVLEHLYDPFTVLRQVARKLKPGGQFLFSTIVRDSLDARIYGRYWAGFDFPRHMVYFTRSDLLGELKQNGFKSIKYNYQIAWIDFFRSAFWKKNTRNSSLLDDLTLLVGNTKLGEIICMPLSWLGLTSRISIKCTRDERIGGS